MSHPSGPDPAAAGFYALDDQNALPRLPLTLSSSAQPPPCFARLPRRGAGSIVETMAEMRRLERSECLKLLAGGGFGRLAVNAGGDAPAIRPVN